MQRSLALAALALGCALTLAPRPAGAFCGFYVGSPGARLVNRATQVVLMRDGVRTVLSMSNTYEGPPDRFAMVIPVPVVLQKENVKTLTRELFDRLDQLDAPRLVEYWEQDPCHPDQGYGYEFNDDPLSAGGFGPNDATLRVRPAAVRVLNRFSAGEYEIVILGAQDSMSLDAWLRENGYQIPAGAEPVLRPYVQSGMKFFVARVDPKKVRFVDGKAALSPLRFHYDTEAFSLPVRLGLLNSAGTQDLVIHVLARGQRYEAANYDNLTIPTNITQPPSAATQFSAVYDKLFDGFHAAHPGAVITEYSWDAASCDPCPTPPLELEDVRALGADVLPPSPPGGFVLTRLHARYDKTAMGADLVFRAAPPIAGGREVYASADALESGSTPAATNNFQARYVIRHPWTGPTPCAAPRRGVWGGAPEGGPVKPIAAMNPAFLAGGPASNFPRYPLPDPVSLDPTPRRGGCAGCRVGDTDAPDGRLGALALLGAIALFVKRRLMR